MQVNTRFKCPTHTPPQDKLYEYWCRNRVGIGGSGDLCQINSIRMKSDGSLHGVELITLLETGLERGSYSTNQDFRINYH